MSETDPRPTPPQDYECCGSECSPCVWDRYYEALHAWNERQTQLKAAQERTGKGRKEGRKGA